MPAGSHSELVLESDHHYEPINVDCPTMMYPPPPTLEPRQENSMVVGRWRVWGLGEFPAGPSMNTGPPDVKELRWASHFRSLGLSFLIYKLSSLEWSPRLLPTLMFFGYEIYLHLEGTPWGHLKVTPKLCFPQAFLFLATPPCPSILCNAVTCFSCVTEWSAPRSFLFDVAR